MPHFSGCEFPPPEAPIADRHVPKTTELSQGQGRRGRRACEGAALPLVSTVVHWGGDGGRNLTFLPTDFGEDPKVLGDQKIEGPEECQSLTSPPHPRFAAGLEPTAVKGGTGDGSTRDRPGLALYRRATIQVDQPTERETETPSPSAVEGLGNAPRDLRTEP